MASLPCMLNLMHNNDKGEQPECKELFVLYRELRDPLAQSRRK